LIVIFDQTFVSENLPFPQGGEETQGESIPNAK